MVNTEGIKLLKERRSIRGFLDTPIPDEVLTDILETCRFCWSAVNKQPWRFIVIKNKEMIQEVAKSCTTGPFAASAPVLVALVGDTEVQPNWYIHDMSFVSLQMALAAWCYGIGTCFIGMIKQRKVKKLLNLKETDHLLTILPLGYPKGGIPETRPRLSLDDLVKYID